MLNRRHIRIKILHMLYAMSQSGGKAIAKTEKELFLSIEKMYEMYLYCMLVMTYIRDVAEQKMEDNKKKRLPTEEDLNPNTRFVKNRFLSQLDANKSLKTASEKKKVSWTGEGELIRKFYRTLLDTEEYKEYMSSPEEGYSNDREVVIRFFKRHLINQDAFQSFFDEKSIFWADDLDIVASMTIKTFKSIDEDSDEFLPILSLWKDPEDEIEFAKNLFRKTLAQSSEHDKLIKEHTENWELERIALMDMLLMRMALSEAREFTQIPLKVTLNEYIEISKYYSTPKSSTFINGVLDKLFDQLKTSGEIKKVGRGLIQ
ncbi:MAG: transcription antitermination factor NusB [Flavobacteriales bacterium]|nr:transcription antitermination factor NusB [Flavobacteriales bacterium]